MCILVETIRPSIEVHLGSSYIYIYTCTFIYQLVEIIRLLIEVHLGGLATYIYICIHILYTCIPKRVASEP